MYGTLYSGNPANVLDTIPKMALGQVVWCANGRGYKYVRLATEATDIISKGHCVYYIPGDLACTSVTCDETDAIGAGALAVVAGIWIRNTTTNALQGFDGVHYAMIQVGGVAPAVGDGSVAAGDPVWGSTTNGVLDTCTEANAVIQKQIVGVALEADTAGTGAGCELDTAHGGDDAVVAMYVKLCNLC